jgi:hypothetical protein
LKFDINIKSINNQKTKEMKARLTYLLVFFSGVLFAQSNINLQNNKNLKVVNTTFEECTYKGKNAIKVMPTATQTEAKFVKLSNVDFTNGSIEIQVVGKRAESAGQNARGFVGVAFRVANDNSDFECFYIRPTNGRANDQLRRNHSVQYISFPDFPWHRLREETPGKYESYSDLVEGEWTQLKIEVSGEMAKFYVGGVEQPTLLVNDLKLGADKKGAIGLWVGPGTEAYFAELKVTEK